MEGHEMRNRCHGWPGTCRRDASPILAGRNLYLCLKCEESLRNYLNTREERRIQTNALFQQAERQAVIEAGLNRPRTPIFKVTGPDLPAGRFEENRGSH
jgi:hypothetical protein